MRDRERFEMDENLVDIERVESEVMSENGSHLVRMEQESIE